MFLMSNQGAVGYIASDHSLTNRYRLTSAQDQNCFLGYSFCLYIRSCDIYSKVTNISTHV